MLDLWKDSQYISCPFLSSPGTRKPYYDLFTSGNGEVPGQELKQSKHQIYTAPQWKEDAIVQIQGSLACTNWNVFEGNLDDRVIIITDYINFCFNTTIPVKTIKNILTLDHR